MYLVDDWSCDLINAKSCDPILIGSCDQDDHSSLFMMIQNYIELNVDILLLIWEFDGQENRLIFLVKKPVLYNIIYIFNIFSYLCHIKSVFIFFFSVTTQADCVIFGSCQVLVHTLASELYIHLWVCVTVCVRVCALVRMVQCSFVRNTRHFY